MRQWHNDPVAALRWRERWAWRRREQAIVASCHADLTAALAGLVGLPVLTVSAGPAGTVTVAVPGWNIGMAGVSAAAQAAFVSLARRPCHLASAGRYGRFWWLTVAATGSQPEERAVVLGASTRVQPAGGGPTPPPPPGLTPRTTRKEYSLS
jgi:hypothetical protein